MKKFLCLLALCCISFSAELCAKEVSKISCAKTDGDNVQCAYQVTGQQMDEPDSVSELYGMSNMPYALCSNVLCQVDKTRPDVASCTCKVHGQEKNNDAWRNASVGPLKYDKAKPDMANGELSMVTSTFSFADLDNKSQTNSRLCTFDKPTGWANCFGVRCVASKNGNNEFIASCDCPVVHTVSFISMGPKDVAQCVQPEDRLWSGATIAQGDNDFAVIEDMYRQFYPQAGMVK